MYKLVNFYAQRFSFPHRGWKYFYRCLRWWGINEKEYRKKLPNGTFMRVTPNEHIQQQLFWYGYYEKPIALLLESIIRPASNILDIGANIGYFSLLAAKKAAQGRVFAFEPVQGLFQKLQLNIEENKMQNVEAIAFAVGETEKEATIFISGKENTGMSSLHPPENFSGDVQPARVITIDQWMKQRGVRTIDIAKLDIEGSELFALKGMKDTLENCKPFLVVELSAPTLGHFGLVPNDVIDFLKNIGYSLFKITDAGRLAATDTAVIDESVAFLHRDKVEECQCYIDIH